MTLEQLIAAFRRDADDTVDNPYGWSDEDVTAWLNEGVDEAAVRGRLIFDSDTPEVCAVSVIAGAKVFALHPAVFEIRWAAFVATAEPEKAVPLRIRTRDWMDQQDSSWRTMTGEPQYLVQDDTKAQIVPAAPEAGTVRLEVYRTAIDPMVAESSEPEIAAAHHAHLVHWALHRAFSVPDSELIDPERAAAAERVFTRYFGPRPDAHLRRDITADQPHHNVSHLI
jgi:hypothetical protein